MVKDTFLSASPVRKTMACTLPNRQHDRKYIQTGVCIVYQLVMTDRKS